MSQTFYEFLIWFPAIVFALTVHEWAHARVADGLGDPTARRLGRLSLNPLVHLDPMGTLLLILVHFGWGKPVPVDPRYLHHPRRDMLLIALAGPLANLGSALFFALLLRFFAADLSTLDARGLFALEALRAAVLIGLLLALFNLLPVPPLDGSRVLAGLLPLPAAQWYQRHSGAFSWGLLLLIAADALGQIPLFGLLLQAPTRWLYGLLVGAGF